LAFGDSLTAGYKLPKEEAYPAQLEILLKEKGYTSIEIDNAGVSGDTSAQGLRRIGWSLKNKKYDFVLLALGANDGLRQLPVKDLKNNLSKMIFEFKKHGAIVLLIGIKLPINFDATYRKEFENVFPTLAKEHSLTFLPFLLDGVALKEKYNLDDQIHPNTQGQKIVAQNIFKALEPALKKNFKVSGR